MNPILMLYALYGVMLGGFFALWQPSTLSRGMSFSELAGFLAAVTALDIVASVPTGIIADKLGRKKTTLFGFGTLAAGFLLPGIWSSPYAIVFTLLAFSIGDNCIDGALDTWAAHLAKKDDTKHDVRTFISRDQIQRAGIIVGSLGLTLIVNKYALSGKLHWLIFVFIALAIILFGASIPDVKVKSTVSAEEKKGFKDFFGFAQWGLLTGIFIYGMSEAAIDTAFAPRMMQLGLTTAFSFGILQACMSGGRLLGGQGWKKLFHIQSRLVPGIAVLGSSLFFLLFAYSSSGAVHSAIFWVLRIAVVSAYFSSVIALTLNSTPAKYHATALSLNTTAYLVGKFLMSSVFAWPKLFPEPSNVLIVGAWLAACSGVSLLIYSRPKAKVA